MKITKHEVTSFINGHPGNKWLFLDKKEALERVSKHSESYYIEYTGEVEIDLFCESCDKDLSQADEYLKIDGNTRYCSDCFEENSFTYYTCGGDQIGDENDSELHYANEAVD
jgi:hypothetical protein